MSKLLIPQKFFKTLKEDYPAIYGLMWIEWLGYGGLIFNPKFCERLKYKNVPKEKVIECYQVGMRFFEEGLVFSDEELQEMKAEQNPEEIDKKKENELFVNAVVSYLNEKLGSRFRANVKETQKYIIARKNEGYSVEDFKKVIDTKVYDWKGTDMEKFLRPITLFAPSKFESYLNQKVFYGKQQQESTLDKHRDAASEAKQQLIGRFRSNQE